MPDPGQRRKYRDLNVPCALLLSRLVDGSPKKGNGGGEDIRVLHVLVPPAHVNLVNVAEPGR